MPKWILVVVIVACGRAPSWPASARWEAARRSRQPKSARRRFRNSSTSAARPACRRFIRSRCRSTGAFCRSNSLEGTRVKQGEVVARVVPLDLKLSHDAAIASIERLDASIKENDDASVEKVSLEQSLKMVETMQSSVKAAEAQVEAARAKLDYNNKNLTRIQRLAQAKAKTEDEYLSRLG